MSDSMLAAKKKALCKKRLLSDIGCFCLTLHFGIRCQLMGTNPRRCMTVLNQSTEHSDYGLPAKIASLTNLQSVITRMASNSQMMKTWAITIVTGFIAIKSTLGGLGCLAYLVPLLLCFCFSYLDAYYLSQERIFRCVYNELASILVGTNHNYLNFSPEIKKHKDEENNSLKKCYKSPSVIYFYLPLAFISTIILIKG